MNLSCLLRFGLCLSLVAVFPIASAFGQPQVKVKLVRLVCEQTTEDGHDEVYYVVGGIDANGKAYSKRGPSPAEFADADEKEFIVNGSKVKQATAWDMNDDKKGKNYNRLLNVGLYQGQLPDGKSTTLTFVFFESDGNTIQQILGLAAKIAEEQSKSVLDGQKKGTKAVQVLLIAKIAQVVGGFLPNNDDDLLGGFSIQVRNQNGNAVVEALDPGSFTTEKFAIPKANNVKLAAKLRPAGGYAKSLDTKTNTFALKFERDKGKYTADFEVVIVK